MMLHTIERRRIDANRLYGLVVSESDTLLLMQREYDFAFDGYVVVRKRDVTKAYSSKGNAYCQKLMRKEGLWRVAPKWVRSLPLNSWEALFGALTGKVVVLENERSGDFWIGPVIEVGARSVLVHYFDSSGGWMSLERVPYRGITAVQFGDRYSTIHAKHLPPRPTN